jgi:hypothetical protein
VYRKRLTLVIPFEFRDSGLPDLALFQCFMLLSALQRFQSPLREFKLQKKDRSSFLVSNHAPYLALFQCFMLLSALQRFQSPLREFKLQKKDRSSFLVSNPAPYSVSNNDDVFSPPESSERYETGFDPFARYKKFLNLLIGAGEVRLEY